MDNEFVMNRTSLVDNKREQERKSINKAIFCGTITFVGVLACLTAVAAITGYFVGMPDEQAEIPITTTPSKPTTTIKQTTTTSEGSGVENEYVVGISRHDVTGPIVQVNMMGYAHPEQIANGLHTRLYSRAFVIGDIAEESLVAFVSFDGGMTSQLIKQEVIMKLQAHYGSDIFTERNVVISGTHTHSAPAGFFSFILFEMTSLGHVEQSTDSFVDGITQSIIEAYDSRQRGTIKIGTGDVKEGNINRSPSSYLKNPQEERDRYSHDTEQEMTMLRFEDALGKAMGALSWYPVHPTSVNFTNFLISSDNKGRAQMLMEDMMKTNEGSLSGKEDFVASFAQANLGDVSPRTNGTICVAGEQQGEQCDWRSTCNNRSQDCVAFGPGSDHFDSCDIVARRQLDTAMDIYNTASDQLVGPIGWVHQYVDMAAYEVKLEGGATVKTCSPGMGFSFAAGTTDGGGAFDFYQGMTEGTSFWITIRNILANILCTTTPPRDYYKCHTPKPVLLPTGYMDKPSAWHPNIVDAQMLRIGQLLIIAAPGEYSTMAGRRLKEMAKKQAVASGMPENTQVVIAGLSNVYTHYITTPEEYAAQRYEAASTIFGPHTFEAYMQIFDSLITPLVEGNQDSVPTGLIPPYEKRNQSRIAPLPSPDKVPDGKNFGDVITDVNATYVPGDIVFVSFHGANPRHDLKIEGTYVEVDIDVALGWKSMYNDAHWSTKFTWLESDPAPLNSDITMFDTLFDVIAEGTGVRFDLKRAMELHEEGRFVQDVDEVMYDDVEGLVLKESKDEFLRRYYELGVLSKEPLSTPRAEVAVESIVTIEWEIPVDVIKGEYRIRYHGHQKSVSGITTPFTGSSSSFSVL